MSEAHLRTNRASALRPLPGLEVERRWSPLKGDALRRRMLAAADLATGLCFALFLAIVPDSPDAVWSFVFVPLWPLLAKIFGLYDQDHRSLRHLTVDELPALVILALVGTALVAALLRVTPAGSLGLGVAVTAALFTLGVSVVLRSGARFAWRRITPRERALILGDNSLAEATRRKFELFPDMHVDLVGDGDEASVEDVLRYAPGELERVVVASETIDEGLIASLAAVCRQSGFKLSLIPPAPGLFGTAVRLRHVADLPIIEYNTWDTSRSTLLLKRMLDVCLSSVALVLTAPLMALIAVAIRLDSRGPVVFSQPRAGLKGKPFTIFKFRTMVANAEKLLPDVVGPLELLPTPMLFKKENDPRVTRVGRVLRRTSLDELPQLWNVLKGQMSLVGPRPERPELVERYGPEHRFRLAVKPGVTGPMQVFGRAALSFEERLAVERDYVENLSLGRDLRILALTVPAVIRGKGAY